jgi:hypothetical protein
MKKPTLQKIALALVGSLLMVACDGGTIEEGTTAPPPAPPASAQIEQEAGKQLADPAYTGLVHMGTRGAWSVYVNKENNLGVASDGTSTLTFDPNNLDQATVGALVQNGLPEELLWSWKGVACRAACWAAGAAGCTAVAGACAWGTVVTFGGFALPCKWAILAACSAAAGGASVCSDWCTKKYG